MGFLTTFTIKNDYIHKIDENPEELIDLIKRAIVGEKINTDLIIAQKPRHIDNTAIYFHNDGTVVNFSEIDAGDFDEWLMDLELYLDDVKSMKELEKEDDD